MRCCVFLEARPPADPEDHPEPEAAAKLQFPRAGGSRRRRDTLCHSLVHPADNSWAPVMGVGAASRTGQDGSTLRSIVEKKRRKGTGYKGGSEREDFLKDGRGVGVVVGDYESASSGSTDAEQEGPMGWRDVLGSGQRWGSNRGQEHREPVPRTGGACRGQMRTSGEGVPGRVKA